MIFLFYFPSLADITNIEFQWLWVFLLFPLPLLLRLITPPAPAENTSTLRVPFFQGIQSKLSRNKPSRSILRFILAIIAWCFLLIAAARPQLIGETINLPITGRSLMMAVDISGSMKTQDMVMSNRRVNRLTAVKAVAGNFITKREGDRIGLILFASRAYLQTPLTFDRKTVKILLSEAAIGLAGMDTALGDSIGLAVKRLRKEPEENRILILLTDGTNTAGNVEPLKAADLAAQEKIKIYAIGVGSEGGVIRTPFGLQRSRGNDLDEETLKAIAKKTGGRYFRARDVESLQSIYTELDKIEPISKDDLSYRPVKEMFHFPLTIALILSVLAALLTLFSATLMGRKQHG